MPLTSVRPILLKNSFYIRSRPSEELYSWLIDRKKGIETYHDIFSKPPKTWFKSNLFSFYGTETYLDGKILSKIWEEFSELFESPKDYLEYMFSTGNYQFVNPDIELDLELWDKYIKNEVTRDCIIFASKWLTNFREKEIIDVLAYELLCIWKNYFSLQRVLDLIKIFGEPLIEYEREIKEQLELEKRKQLQDDKEEEIIKEILIRHTLEDEQNFL